VKNPATTLTKIAFPQLQCERNAVTPGNKRTCDVAEKWHFITKVSYKTFLVLVGTKLNTPTYRFQTAFLFTLHSIMLQHQTWKHLQKTNDTSSSGVARVSRAWGQAQFRCSHPALSWQHEMKEILQFDALVAILLFQGQGFLPFSAENISILLLKSWYLIWFKCVTYFDLENIQRQWLFWIAI